MSQAVANTISNTDPQFNRFNKLHHFIDINGLDKETLTHILDTELHLNLPQSAYRQTF